MIMAIDFIQGLSSSNSFGWHVIETIKNRGWGNGYITITSSHWLFNYDNEDDLNCLVLPHGGWTYISKKYNTMVIGFDTGHPGDTPGNWPKSRVIEHTKDLATKLYNLKQPEPEPTELNSFDHCEVCGKEQGECRC